jgi:hypothetical protein
MIAFARVDIWDIGFLSAADSSFSLPNFVLRCWQQPRAPSVGLLRLF